MSSKRKIIKQGFDAGYGRTKLAGTGRETVDFPSVWAVGREPRFASSDYTEKYPGDQVWEDESHWFVGDLALAQSSQLLTLRGQSANESAIGHQHRLRLFKAAMGKMFAGMTGGDVIHVRLASGLPVNHMSQTAVAAMKEAFIGKHHVKTDTADIVVNVLDTMAVMPQPMGAVYQAYLCPDGQISPAFPFRDVAVIDVGTYTTDFVRSVELEYIDDLSGTIEVGGSKMFEEFSRLFRHQYGSTPSLAWIQSAVELGNVVIGGQYVNLRGMIAQAYLPVIQAVQLEAQALWGSGLEIERVLLVGGHAKGVRKAIEELYPVPKGGVDRVQMSNLPITANAVGYLQYLEFDELYS